MVGKFIYTLGSNNLKGYISCSDSYPPSIIISLTPTFIKLFIYSYFASLKIRFIYAVFIYSSSLISWISIKGFLGGGGGMDSRLSIFLRS